MSDQNRLALGYLYQFQKQIEGFSEPLNLLGISNFFAIKIFENDQYILLSNNWDWLSYHLLNIHDHGAFFRNAYEKTPIDEIKLFLWPSQPTDSVLQALHEHDIWNGVSFVIRHECYVEHFCFSGNRKNTDPNNLYLNDQDLLKRFISYFKANTLDIIKNYDPNYRACFKEKVFTPFIEHTDCSAKEFSKLMKQTPKFLKSQKGLVILSNRQFQILQFLAKGKTYKEISELLGLAIGTIESYVKNIKKKTGYSTRSEIVSAFLHVNPEKTL